MDPCALNDEFPQYLLPEIAKLGIVGADCPKSVGGQGLSCVDMGPVMYELASKDASIAAFFLLHNSLGNYAVARLAKDNLRSQILAETFSLNKIIGWAITEPKSGSKVHTTATKFEGGYVLNGHKKIIGNNIDPDFLLVWARNASEHGKIQCFLVRKDAKGLSRRQLGQKSNLRAVQHGHFVLNNVIVPENERLCKAKDFETCTKDILKHFWI